MGHAGAQPNHRRRGFACPAQLENILVSNTEVIQRDETILHGYSNSELVLQSYLLRESVFGKHN